MDQLSAEIAKAERRGYSKGYAARGRRLRADRSRQHWQEKRDAFWRAALLASIEAVMYRGWTQGGQPLTTIKQRMGVAREIADAAVNEALMAGRL